MSRERVRQSQHRLRVLRSWMASPTDVWLLVRIVAWSVVLPILKHVVPLPALVRFLWAGRPSGTRWPEREHRIVQLAFWLYRSRRPTARGRCLERSLLLYHFLALCQANPQLVVGVCTRGEGLLGHAWVNVEGRPVGESLAAIAEFVPILMAQAGGPVQPGATTPCGADSYPDDL